MEEHNIHINRKLPTDAEIEKTKDFEKLLAMYHAQPTNPTETTPSPAPTSPGKWLWLAPIAACLVLGLWWFNFKGEKETPAISQTEIAPVVKPDTIISEQKPSIVEKDAKTALEPVKKEVLSAKNTEKKTAEVSKTSPAPVKEIVAEDAKKTDLLENNSAAPKKATRKPFRLEVDNLDQFPELKNYQNYQWEYAGDDVSKDPWKNNVFGEENQWDAASISKSGENYEMTLSRKDRAKVSFPVRMVFTGKAYQEAVEKFKQKPGGLGNNNWE